MGFLDIILGARCDMCGQRKDDVGKRPGTGMELCTKCSKSLKRADRSSPPGSRSSGYKPGQPPKLAGPMGSKYRGPEPPAQRRR
jgi:hypothetical protein